ncbi:MAG: hypothetical protein ABSG86_22845 [Thermoguttaceae bacterium]|jgi:hypothetical protein
MPSCGHIDWPCCGCGDDLEHCDDGDICQGCGEPEAHCCCDEYEDDCDGDDRMDGDHETALASAGWGTDEDYLPGGSDDFGGDW